MQGLRQGGNRGKRKPSGQEDERVVEQELSIQAVERNIKAKGQKRRGVG